LGFWGRDLYQKAPPIPKRVVTDDGVVLFTSDQIRDGQNVWQSTGGQEQGSVWGHGAYVAPDWSADRLHREATALLDIWARHQAGVPFDQVSAEWQAILRARLKQEFRTNTYDAVTGDVTVSPDRADAIRAVSQHYASLFGDDPAGQKLRQAYAIPAGAVKDPQRRQLLNAFFFWTAWTCGTDRPGADVTYTNNWPGVTPPRRLSSGRWSAS
jgi:nitric oxide reductase subunit B